MEETSRRGGPGKPHNLHGLLNFCTELTAVEDTTRPSHHGPLDEEKRAFLSNVLSEMSSNVPKILLGCISKLLDDNISNDIKEGALEELTEYLEDIDHAQDFYKLGGFPALEKHLEAPHVPLRHLSAQLIGDICQNNQNLQNEIILSDVLSTLYKMMLNDPERICRVRAIYAVSCIIRENDVAQKKFLSSDGFSLLLQIVQEKREDLITKTIFLLNNLYQKSPCRDSIRTQAFIQAIIALLCAEVSLDAVAREYATRLLLNFSKDSEEAKNILENFKKSEFIMYLQNRFRVMEGKAEFQEESSYVKELLSSLRT